MKHRLKVNGVIIVAAVTIVAVFPAFFLRNDAVSAVDLAAELLGLSGILMGQILRASARGYKSEASRQGMKLVDSGPYSFVRNPMYLGILLVGFGVVLMLFRWWATAVFLVVFVFRYILLINVEERKLRAHFGAAFDKYTARVPRLIPNPVRLIQRGITVFLPLKHVWLKREVGTIIALVAGVWLIDSWEDVRWAGFRMYAAEVIAITILIAAFAVFCMYLIARTNQREQDASK